ncbi:MAG TPA: alpha-galactosidase, partial [Alphaproteobacteria bacterium]|nr:alpha-galactosidase [Alphaproteobacteria bacterium]
MLAGDLARPGPPERGDVVFAARIGALAIRLPMVAPLVRTVPDARAPRVEPRGLAVRLGSAGDARTEWAGSDLSAGRHGLADDRLELTIDRTDHGDAVTFRLGIVNRAAESLFVESVVLGMRFLGHGSSSHRFLRNGWQSWSFTGYGDLDEAGEPPFPSGAWLRGMYHCVGSPAPERAGWHESETVSVVGRAQGGACCLAGVLETGRAFGIVHLRPAEAMPHDSERAVDLDVELRVEVSLEPGEGRELEAVRVAVGPDANVLLERFATLWGAMGGARTRAPFQTGWCSWYHYFHRITEEDLLRNLDVLTRSRDTVPIDVVQLDDGYQRAIGDWHLTNDAFPRGLAPIAEAIRDAGFVPGLWTAPFAASAESELLRGHPEWALRDGDGWLRGTHNPEWSADGWVYALDPSHPGFRTHLEHTYRALVDLGFSYQKLDFLYMAAMEGGATDPGSTRAARLRAGLAAIRRGAGEEAFLLGCGSPLGPAVGLVDGMRIGPDVAPCWGIDRPDVIPGLAPMLPSTGSALRSIESRLFMHRRLWLNDPDCLMA